MPPPNRIANPQTPDVFGPTERHRVYGVVFGIVESNDDPSRQGRLQISFPWLGSSMWALVASPPSSAPSSKYQVGDQVVVAFEHGDTSHPVVLGRLGS